MRASMGMPWLGAQKNSSNLIKAFIDFCTKKDDIVMDPIASTCYFLNY